LIHLCITTIIMELLIEEQCQIYIYNKKIVMKIFFDNITGSGKVYLDVMKAICGDTSGKSMIDLGCNTAPYTCQLGFEKRKYIDIIERKLDDEKEQQYFECADMLHYLRLGFNYDCTISSDSIEHLTVTNGSILLSLMGNFSKKQIIFTPLNEWMIDLNSKDPEGHHSLWTPELIPDYASIVFQNYHPTLNIGAWFGWKCDNLEQDFERVKNELKQKGYE